MEPATSLEALLNRNQEWVARTNESTPEFFAATGKVHKPSILWIGCADARVPANTLIDLPPGRVFVHRNIANLVNETDSNCSSVVQYAVSVLQVEHIIVCGHFDCGGVKASMQPREACKLPNPLNGWLESLRELQESHKTELEGLEGDAAVQKLVELNVRQQCVNVSRLCRRMAVESGTKRVPHVCGVVYNPSDGLLKPVRALHRCLSSDASLTTEADESILEAEGEAELNQMGLHTFPCSCMSRKGLDELLANCSISSTVSDSADGRSPAEKGKTESEEAADGLSKGVSVPEPLPMWRRETSAGSAGVFGDMDE
uniref:Carbonic anhydrase n=1 Tax=Chromera velia CCMP2878 TaxID=1169474 RepID=A0A0G4GJE8_9ALVE|mmetsp:Transcript_49544/g.97554  ORF Transcript_49544/g.97554 Transcript_49544/m.97554 type:complete len:315 (+) Transcript_49544:152-1096(+)|eukprot:Cvel_22163.t1-p1 / transcript=Cvel_22163.t1 / gene=Cvel_22163 / organism=Chromera_velia_CCMP2878 / gene_product=Carbonic anhydrase, putative / transcript_product=Carbonic anhydrase, putative / location=Cvel_scaffold2151:16114-17227(+) / protein_length=314 / sequence_SO=supercontig / SO=protein_coding / is_pseudo=false